ncbi:hypothetical protein LSH36_347g01027 [Paralvinella palmiformis]|uniref:Uncharacterized protein n=1 Tax=Paralvinella palmiformis TaxID=53620 RepID=A0AAD9JEY8_9ANNE|nr:hypothetical protein LSH36_347g01027 [Paralvinella palmiformis]
MAANVRGRGDGRMTVHRLAKSAGHVTGYGTLASYPMERSHTDTMKVIADCRRTVDKERAIIGLATVMSDRLWRYGKMLFDDAVEGASRLGSAASGDASLPRISPDRVHVPAYANDGGASRKTRVSRAMMTSSGPSHFGSPIYNHRPKLLNDIRLRPKTGTRATSRDENNIKSDIKYILEASNTKYRVVPSTVDSVTSRQRTYSHVSGYQEYLLVPRDGDVETETEIECGSSYIEKIDTCDEAAAPSIGSGSTEVANQSDMSGPMDLDLESCSGDDQGPSPEADRGSGKEIDPECRPGIDPEDEPNCDSGKQTDPDRTKLLSRGGANSSLTSPSVRSVYRKVTWIDQLTVSTPEVASKPEQNLPTTDPRAGANDVNSLSTERQPEVRKVVNLNDLRANSWSLPDFICPTSEEKSKQARMAAWLQTSNFTNARKTVPLL